MNSSLRRRLAIIIAAGGLLLGTGITAHAVLGDTAGPAEVGVRSVTLPPEISQFYIDRGFEPLWTDGRRLNGGALRLLEYLERAPSDGLRRENYIDPALAALVHAFNSGDSSASTAGELEARLSTAFVRFASDRHSPAPENDLIRVDDAVKTPQVAPRTLLASIAAASGRAEAVDAALQLHPEYERLSTAYSHWRDDWGSLPGGRTPNGPTLRTGDSDGRVPALRSRLGIPQVTEEANRLDEAVASRLADFQKWHGLAPSGALDAATVKALNIPPADYERRMLVNLDRLRALPAQPGRRHILVNVAAGSLMAIEEDRLVRRMKVIVGRPNSATPMMAGVIRYAILTPYWNVPHDLVRDQVAPAVLERGPPEFRRRNLEALADWSPEPALLPPETINWRAVRSGAQRLRVRQKPGPHNMMGEVKFMLPNDLGIYLHDTPERSGFTRAKRTFSAGCVRVEDAQWLGAWLFGTELGSLRSGQPEQRVDLAEPTAVMLMYQTIEPRTGGGFAFHHDVYDRDAPAPERR